MSVIGRVRKWFGTTLSGNTTMPTDKIAATKAITNNLAGYLLGLSDFNTLTEDEIYEQLYVWEPEIGGAIDRMSTMVGESYKYCYVNEAADKIGDIEEKMVKDANKIADSVDVKRYFDIFTELLSIHGNFYGEKLDGGKSIGILPNRYVTLIDTEDRLTAPVGTNLATSIITTPNILVLFEGMDGMKKYPSGNYIHIRYKDTPVFIKDSRGRTTYGVYSVSPLQRTIISIWWKRQTMIIDIMWRLRNVPREHHSVDAEMFSLDKYAGDMATRRTAAMADAKTFLDTYVDTINNQMPDQGYATLSTVSIEMIESKNSSYMQTNELIAQINNQVWAALNMPKAMILGESDSSYAGELVIANYVAQKVNQITNKIKPVILDVIRARLKDINSDYPVEKLDMYFDPDIATTDLETFRQLAIMAELGTFTMDEIRERAKYAPMTDKQKAYRVEKTMGMGSTQFPNKQNSPQTPQSNIQHATDSGENKYRQVER